MTERETLAIDFDGTIVSNAWPEFGKPISGAAKAIKHLANDFNILIYTSRIAAWDMDGRRRSGVDVAKEIRGVDRVLKKMGLGYLEIHQDPFKPGAWAYIDDKNIEFNGDWNQVLQKIEVRKVASLLTAHQKERHDST